MAQTLRASGEQLAALAADLKARVTQRHAGEQTLDTQMADSLVDLGLIDPVTKKNAGTRYQEQLARQLASFLEPVLRRESGMMALHDVYCVFNRCVAEFTTFWLTLCTSGQRVHTTPLAPPTATGALAELLI